MQELLSDSLSVTSKYQADGAQPQPDVRRPKPVLKFARSNRFFYTAESLQGFRSTPSSSRWAPGLANANIPLTDTVRGRVLGHPSHLQGLQNQFRRSERGWKFLLQSDPAYGDALVLGYNLPKQILDNSLFHVFSCNRGRSINIRSRG